MRILSKLTALLLALMMVLAAPLTVSAENQVIRTMSEYMQVADNALYDAIMAFDSYGDYWEIGELLQDEDVIAYIANNDEDRIKAIQEHLDTLFWEACVSYAGNPGPLMPPVETAPSADMLKAVSRDLDPDNGLQLDKTADPLDNGNYCITLEAYAEGSVKQEVKGVPVDIVLVLDVSSSMGETFGSGSRLKALQTAVNAFIDVINDKYTDTTNHRIGIVLFDGDTYNGEYTWAFMDDTNATNMKNWVDDIELGSGTNPGVGMQKAANWLTTGYGSPTPTTRQKAVVLFTDGRPSNISYAINAINYAHDLKEDGVTIYSVAVHQDAKPTSTPATDLSGSYGDTNTINAMMHAVSSNYPDATAASRNGGARVTYGSRTTVDGETVDYYFTADDPADLTSRFENIAEQVQSGSAAIQLGSSTVVMDVVSQYFQLPEGATEENIKVYTSDYKGNGVWADRVLFNAAVEIDGRNVSVSNFDYTRNFVAETGRVEGDATQSGSFFGRKLIIEFEVEPTDGFLGGDGVVTNDVASGVYQPGADGTLVPVEAFPIPEVSVDVPPLQIIGEDQHIYLGNNASLDEMLQSFSVYYNIVDDSGTKVSGPHKVDSILNHYVQLDFDLKLDNVTYATYSIEAAAKKGNWTYNNVTSETLNVPFTEDETFHIAYTATATESNQSDGDMTANIYVYTPEVTFKDSEHEYLETATAEGYYDKSNFVSLKWYNANKKQYSTEENIVDAATGETVSAMLGTAPVLTYTYTPASDTWITDGVVTGTACVPVNVTQVVINGDNEITISEANNTGYLKTLRQVINCTDCANKDGKATETSVAGTNICEFVVHIHNVFADLTINKAGMSNGESAVVQVVVNANGTDQTYMLVFNNDNKTAVIAGLPIGSTYAVTELNNWSWRYKDGAITYVNTEKKIVADETRNVVNITNTRSNDQWMSDESAVENNLGTGSSVGHNNQ